MISIGIVLIILILACVIGNLLVIIAILIERDLRSRPQYYLIFSLAVADLLVGLIVTPLGAWSTVLRAWTLGVTLCDFWISVDVLVCTSSILHLVAIALDRYWSITDICYVQNRTPRRIFGMLGSIWIVSLLISLAPILGWKDEDFFDRVEKQQVFSTATAFYIPLCAIICIYYKIMRAATRRFKRERDRRTIIHRNGSTDLLNNQHRLLDPKKMSVPTVTLSRTSSAERNRTSLSKANGQKVVTDVQSKVMESSPDTTTEEDRTAMPSNGHCMVETRIDDHVATHSKPMLTRLILPKKRRSKESSEMKRERKAWRTLAIITGTFVACWTPFFLISLYRPICQCRIPILLESVTNWLGQFFDHSFIPSSPL
ncbi:unnamed protein product [Anisakis simplex]|uniref:G_PROTEIN_RECEP_F1_2 domain-containing protein n=1 Tax=Anisakis simplex TaxID=6269 RepID=A0A0M3K4P5_ANISI|nr:unnamed protein product [Anisakis simplex]